MRQVFRLMDMPDKVIAFDELPEALLEGLEMLDCSKLPRHWREFIGMRERIINIRPERDPFTHQLVKYPPVVEKAPFAFLIDRELNHDKERWGEIESYVKRVAPKDFRLTDKLIDMAKPMAVDAHSELNLEPEDVIVVPLPKVEEAKDPTVSSVSVLPPVVEATLKCDRCEKTFSSKQAIRMHTMKRHPEPGPAVAA